MQSETKEINSIVFVFKQFELIPKETVEQFVSLVSCYVENIPIYFIIELASQSNILYEQLSSAIISKLCIKKLYLMSPELYLDKFLTRLFIEQTTLFKLSGDILKTLVETYYEYNFSITSLIHALKVNVISGRFHFLFFRKVQLLFLKVIYNYKCFHK